MPSGRAPAPPHRWKRHFCWQKRQYWRNQRLQIERRLADVNVAAVR
jgi:hypothetical protein